MYTHSAKFSLPQDPKKSVHTLQAEFGQQDHEDFTAACRLRLTNRAVQNGDASLTGTTFATKLPIMRFFFQILVFGPLKTILGLPTGTGWSLNFPTFSCPQTVSDYKLKMLSLK